jgi:hypothetical protein
VADQKLSSTIIEETQQPWGMGRKPLGCPHCRRVFLVKQDQLEKPCPLCRQGKLEPQPARMRPVEPEKLLPFKITQGQLQSAYENFVSGVWIKPEDFTVDNLLKRTVPLFWPLWLVDSDIAGHWQMEAGFDYQVESTKEFYSGGRWQSRKQIETRVRWEPRLGEISHHVDNVAVQALDEHENRLQMTGRFPLEEAEDFNPNFLGNALLEVPDLPPEDAWPLAKPKVNQAVGEVCARAVGADHARNFALKADYTKLNWTQLYLPFYATYYKDDEGQPQILIVNGVTGRIQGPRLASRQRGLRIAGIIAIITGVFLLLALIGLLLAPLFPPAGIIAALLGLLGFGIGIAALVPAIWPGQWNRKQDSPRITSRRR